MARPSWHGPGLLITRAVEDLGDGTCRVTGGRQFRKGIGSYISPIGSHHRVSHSSRRAFGISGWGGLNDWIAVLFLTGSFLFGLGAVGAMLEGTGFGLLRTVFSQNVTFFTGSIFFTSAAYLQWRQAVSRDLRKVGLSEGRAGTWWEWRPRDCGYMAGFTQLVGTLLFNFNTGDPIFFPGGWMEQDVVVWTPNMIGCGFFLAASIYACIEVGQGFWVVEVRNISWWVAWCNLAGSVFFQLSAFASLELPGASGVWAAFPANLFTALGAFGFFLAAALMIPEARDRPVHPEMGGGVL